MKNMKFAKIRKESKKFKYGRRRQSERTRSARLGTHTTRTARIGLMAITLVALSAVLAVPTGAPSAPIHNNKNANKLLQKTVNSPKVRQKSAKNYYIPKNNPQNPGGVGNPVQNPTDPKTSPRPNPRSTSPKKSPRPKDWVDDLQKPELQQESLYDRIFINEHLLVLMWTIAADSLIFIGKYCKGKNRYFDVHAWGFGTIAITNLILIVRDLIEAYYEDQNTLEIASKTASQTSPPATLRRVLELILTQKGVLRHAESARILEYSKNTSKDHHIILGLYITIAAVLMALEGLFLRFTIACSKRYKWLQMVKNFDLTWQRKIHFVAGVTMWIVIRWSLLAGAHASELFLRVPIFVFTIVEGVIAFLLFFTYELRYRLQTVYCKVNLASEGVGGVLKDKKNLEILEKLRQKMSPKELKEAYPGKNVVIYLARVYDLGEYVHPGGNWIYRECRFREVSRYLIGAYGVEGTGSRAWRHSQVAFRRLEEHSYIGNLYDDSRDSEWILRSVETGKAGFSHDQPWKLISRSEISGNLFIYQFSHSDFQVKLDALGADWIGRHYILEVNGIRRLYTSCSMLDPGVVEYRKWLKIEFENLMNSGQKDDLEEGGEGREDVLKASEFNGARNLRKRSRNWLENRKNLISDFDQNAAPLSTDRLLIPKEGLNLRSLNTESLILNKNLKKSSKSQHPKNDKIDQKSYPKHSETLTLIIKAYDRPKALSQILKNTPKQSKIKITGPVGQGLPLPSNFSGTIAIIAAGTGILPFIDLLDLLYKKAIFEVLKKTGKEASLSIIQPVQDYSRLFPGGTKFSLFCSFDKIDDFLGFEWIQHLAEISRKHSLGLFECVCRLSESTRRALAPISRTKERFDREFFKERFLTGSGKNGGLKFDRLFVCGPERLHESVLEDLKALGVDKQDIHFV